jgi:hypothetical protein
MGGMMSNAVRGFYKSVLFINLTAWSMVAGKHFYDAVSALVIGSAMMVVITLIVLIVLEFE